MLGIVVHVLICCVWMRPPHHILLNSSVAGVTQAGQTVNSSITRNLHIAIHLIQ